MEKSDFKKPFNKPVLEKIGKYNAQVVALALVFILVSLVGFGIGLIDPSLLYATIPLIVIPAFFSFQTSLSVLLAGKGISNRINYSSYMSYFIPPFKGSYRVIVSYFKSLLVFAFFSLITGSIYYGIASSVSTSFVEAINKLAELTNTGTLEAIIEHVFSNKDLISFYYSVQGVGLGLSSIYFLYCISFNSLNAHLRSKIGGPSSGALNALFKKLVLSDKKLFIGSFITRNIPLFILFGLGFGISFTCFGIFAPTYPTFAVVISLFAGLLLSSFYLPYTFASNEMFMLDNSVKIKKFFIDFSIKSLEEMKEKALFSQEQLEKADENLKEAEKMLEDEIKQKEKENQDDSPKDYNSFNDDSSN